MFCIKKKYLLLIAGLFWVFAGVMVVKIGYLQLFLASKKLLMTIGAVVVLMIFYLFIFSPLVYKHEIRIRSNQNVKMPFWQFFDMKSYLIVIFMMTFGMTLRSFELVPKWFIAFFYSGLGTALYACGIRFIIRFYRYDKGFNIIPRLEKRLKK